VCRDEGGGAGRGGPCGRQGMQENGGQAQDPHPDPCRLRRGRPVQAVDVWTTNCYHKLRESMNGRLQLQGQDMQEPLTWRDFLANIIQEPQERQRIANELGVNPVTLTRWVNKEATPRSQNIHRLLKALPQHRKALLELLSDEFDGFSAEAEEELTGDSLQEIPREFYVRVLRTRATIPKDLRFSSLCDLILQQALKQLDPQRLGMAIIIARYMPPSHEGKIRSLRESLGRGTAPWGSNLEQQAILLGAESLAGHAVTSGRLVVNQNLTDGQGLSPGYRGIWEESAAAAPIMLEGKVAGSLLVSSTQPNYFLLLQQTLIQDYADLIALAFRSEEFYETQQIALGLVPLQEVQQAYFSVFRKRLSETLVQAARQQQALTVIQAEQLVWQQFEEELLQLPRHVESQQDITTRNAERSRR
jgi:GAF domain